jgi:outer membrane protein TolC
VRLRFKPAALALTLMAGLAGCAMGPDYERPEVPVPEAYQEPAIPGASIANLKWWELFRNEELTALITAALINNKELAIATARIEETRALLGFVRADQFPNLDGAAGAVRGNTTLSWVSAFPATSTRPSFLAPASVSRLICGGN